MNIPFIFNSSNCAEHYNPRYKPPNSSNLTIYQRGAQYLGIKIFNNLPLGIKIVAHSQKKFKHELKKVCNHIFCTMEEYLTHS